MKKIIALLLALIMTFSMGTVAFAEGEVAGGDETVVTPPPSEGGEGESEAEGEDAEGTEDSILGEYDWILDLPFGTVKPALKVAKIVLKLAKVYVKLAIIFGIIDKDALIDQIGDFIGGLIGDEQPPETEETPVAPETGEEALQAA